MPFFLPSYFQKRLLRYALSRLQLVDTDELDLDNLGVTLGQRSVIELKNVGLKLKELSTILNLPPTATLGRARVRLLKITIPADLYASGIVVELHGVHVHLRLQNEPTSQKQKASQHRTSATPSRGDKASLPRIASPDIYDPGGDFRRRAANRGDAASAIPSSNDLAESFLQLESREERLELEAAIASQSQMLEASVVSSGSGDGDLGIGATEGVSLPGFLANFLRGIENRLQASIQDVAFLVEMDLQQSLNEKDASAEARETTRIMIRISEVVVGEHTLSGGDGDVGMEKRAVSVHDISVSLLSEPELFAQDQPISAASSPTTKRSNTKAVPIFSASGEGLRARRSKALGSPTSTDRSRGDRSSSKSIISTEAKNVPTIGRNDSEVSSTQSPVESTARSISDGALDDSALFRSSVSSSIYHEEQSDSSSESEMAFAASTEQIPDRISPVAGPRGHWPPQVDSSISTSTPRDGRSMITSEAADDGIDNMGHAELLARAGQIDTSDHGLDSRDVSLEDLTQSRLFSHDEAESMYMSAIGKSISASPSRNTMPGGWDWGDPALPQSEGSPERIVQRVPPTSDLQETSDAPGRHAVRPATEGAEVSSSVGLTPAPASPVHEETRSAERPDIFDDALLTAKRLLSIDRITVRVPARGSHVTSEYPSGQTQLNVEKIPMRTDTKRASFVDDSYHSEVGSSLFRSEYPGSETHAHISSKGQELDPPKRPIAAAFEVQILNIQAQFDLMIGKALAKATKKILDTFAVVEENTSAPTARSSSPVPPLALEISNVILRFREHVSEHALSFPPFAAGPGQSSPEEVSQAQSSKLLHSEVPQFQPNHLLDDDLLLQLALARVNYTTSSELERAKQRLTVSKMSLSHATGDVLSFNQDIKMRDSVKDLSAWTAGDLLMTVESANKMTKIAVQTKPFHLKLDLPKLDDVLSRSGGLSSLLELGNSIVSTSTVRSNPRKPEREIRRAQGVHFEKKSAGADLYEDGRGTAGKINVRVAGAMVELIGSESIMKLRSSAVKVVYRQEGLGVQIDRVVMDGPFFPGRTESADVNMDLGNIRLEYLPVPKEADLDRLLSILTPSKDKYDKEDDIMVDTLLRQRRKGGVLRVTVGELRSFVNSFEHLTSLSKLGSELGKLSTVTKYLPEDDRPGILTLGLIKKLDHQMHMNHSIGNIRVTAELVEGAHVNVPSLVAAQIHTLSLFRNEDERLLGEAIPSADPQAALSPPMIMCRFIADEMEPTVKLKLFNTCFEYHVSTIIAILDMNSSTGDSQASSKGKGFQAPPSPSSTSSSARSQSAGTITKRAKIAISIRDSAIGINPSGLESKCLLVLTDASLLTSFEGGQETNASLEIKKASIMIIDNVARINSNPIQSQQKVYFDLSDHVQNFTSMGYVPVGFVSSASAVIRLQHENDNLDQILDVEFRNNLFILETCADSTQTLIGILNNLSPPTPPSKVSRYRTEIVPIEDLLASFTGDAYFTEPDSATGLRASAAPNPDFDNSKHEEIEYLSDYYQPEPGNESDPVAESFITSDLSESMASISVAPVSAKESVIKATQEDALTHSLLDFREDHFSRSTTVGGTAHRWDSAQNTYGLASEKHLQGCPLKFRVRDIHVIWNLFDGYDWQSTRDTISQAVKDIETRASTKRSGTNSRLSPGVDDEEESVIGDFLFNSIYIGIPAHKDPRELANEINRNLDDGASDTGSYATTTTITGSSARQGQGSRVRQKKLRLNRSKQHKMTFELNGISADFLAFPAGSSEVESSIDVRVKSLEVFDHVPTSTWKKFATYMQDAGERQTDTSMIHLEILNVKPVADLAASEMILKVTVLPLRLHVDQDALDFMSRFFEFKDESAPIPSAPSSPPFLQRVEVNPIRIKLDFKPKRVDYGGLRSGRTTEFMNFFILDQADMVLRRVILYGVSGFDRLGIMLNSIWTPDVRSNQLPGILAGLAPIRSIVNVGSGVKDLVVVPMNEYKKDGRIVRSIQKGALAFAKTTTKELVNLGAKLAIGTQTVLQNTETMLGPGATEDKWEGGDDEEESKKQISLYADQPVGVVQGLRGAYASLERDLLLARDAIVAVPGEIMASGSATGAARAVLKQTPTIILRPAIGATKAVGQTLLGAGNSLDRENWRRMDEKYKKH